VAGFKNMLNGWKWPCFERGFRRVDNVARVHTAFKPTVVAEKCAWNRSDRD